MKKIIVMTVAAVSLVAMQAMATVSVEISAENLYDHSGASIGLNTEVLMVVDTGNNGLPSGTLSPFSIGANADGTTMSLALAGGAPAGDIIVWKGTPGGTTTIAGQIDLAATITLSGGVAAGQKVGLVWLTNNNSGPNGTTAAGGQFYGSIESASVVLPADGGTAGFDFADTGNAGSDTIASHTANAIIQVPEPSSIALAVMGLLGGVGLIRRRK